MTGGAPCGHTGVHRCNGLTLCRVNIRNKPGQHLSDYLTPEEAQRLQQIPLGRPCTGCQQMLATELDFAQHFTIPDMLYPGLGECPNKHTREST